MLSSDYGLMCDQSEGFLLAKNGNLRTYVLHLALWNVFASSRP